MEFKLACVCCHYNFANYGNNRKNLIEFLNNMQQHNVPIYGVELVLPNQEAVTMGNPNWRQITIDTNLHIMWQKETLLNLAEKLIPEEYNAIAWIDADIVFENKLWVQDTCNSLKTYDVVQLFEYCNWLNIDGDISLKGRTIVSLNNDITSNMVTRTVKYHTGFAWAMKRSLWQNIGGLYNRCVKGGADLVMAHYFLQPTTNLNNEHKLYITHDVSTLPEIFLEWARNLGTVSVGNIAGTVLHNWHGTRGNRQHTKRKLIPINIETDIEVDSNKILRWSEYSLSSLRRAVRAYFYDRREG